MFLSEISVIILVFYVFQYETKQESLEWDIFNNDYFIGYIYKNSDNINIYPEIKVKTNKNIRVCNFILISKDGKELPFLANLKYQDNGIGEIVLTGPVDSDRYEFYIQAKACKKEIFSKEMKMIVKVNMDVKIKEKELPLWDQVVYNAAVFDDVPPGSEVIRVKAYELGKSISNSICDYMISAPLDSPFDIDGNGVLKTTTHLDARKHRNYVLRVTAIDCWIPNSRNSSISINIEVKRLCTLDWKGVYERMDYPSSSGIKRFARNMELSHCDNSLEICQNQEVISHLTLINPNTKICDRDSWSLRHQWKSCGIHNRTIELLPSADQFVREDYGYADALTGIYIFDGIKTRWEIPTNVISSDHFLGKNFTFSFWMKHDTKSDIIQQIKEQILCNSDGNAKNRHHYSLFLHNCKLIFLHRSEGSVDNEAFLPLSPTEWRFKSPEMCDNNWHHYSFIVENVMMKTYNFKASFTLQKFSVRQVKLFIDGAMFPYEVDNPAIIDDMPMHKMPQVHFTKLSIGACWHSESSSYIQHFKGELAGMIVLRGKSESASVIECINQCHERLAFTGINKMAAGTSISINSLMSSMTITASHVKDVATIIEQMGYINSRWNPLAGRRRVELSTMIKCSNNIKLNVPTKVIQVIVLSKDEKRKEKINVPEESHGKEYALRVAGDELIEITSQDVVTEGIGSGIPILPNVTIVDVTNEDLGSLLLWGKPTLDGHRKQYKLNGVSMVESCLLHVFPPLKKQQEYLSFTNSIIEDLSDQGIYLNVTNSSIGLVIEGDQSMSIYRFVLQRIVYFNSKLNQFQEKIFKLVCSKHSAHSISNELVIKLSLSQKLRGHIRIVPLNTYVHLNIHGDIKMNQFEHKSQSEMASLPIGSDSVIQYTNNTSPIAVILSICVVFVIISTALILLRIVKSHQNKLTDPFSRSKRGPWVRLKPKFPFKKPSLRSINSKMLPVTSFSGEMEWDSSELYTSSILDESFQITVNPLAEHEKEIEIFNCPNNLSSKINLLDHDDKSLDGLPEEYDGRSEDFRDMDDDMNIEEENPSNLIDDIENMHFYRNGKSFSHNAIYDDTRDWCGPLNIHHNPRYTIKKTYSN